MLEEMLPLSFIIPPYASHMPLDEYHDYQGLIKGQLTIGFP